MPITTAIPAVKPVVTGCGMYVMSRPSLASPMPTRIRPAMKPARSSPPKPNRVTIGTRMTTNAAVGPVTWQRVPPRSEETSPATIAV